MNNTSPHVRWVSDPLGAWPVEIMNDVLERMPVTLIVSTTVHTCQRSDSAKETALRDSLLDFDYVPVFDASAIVGVFERGRFLTGNSSSTDTVGDVMLPLTGRMLLSADASVLTFIENAHSQRFALVLRGRDVAGIVTLSDLQKLAVRPTLFSLLTLLEMMLAEWIRLNSDNDSWMNALADQHRARIEREYNNLREQNMMIDKITATSFNDKIIAATSMLHFPGGRAAAQDLHEVRLLRNSVFHHHNLGEKEEAAIQISRRVRLARDYLSKLADDMDPGKPFTKQDSPQR